MAKVADNAVKVTDLYRSTVFARLAHVRSGLSAALAATVTRSVHSR